MKTPRVLDQIVDKVLAYRPKDKNKKKTLSESHPEPKNNSPNKRVSSKKHKSAKS